MTLIYILLIMFAVFIGLLAVIGFYLVHQQEQYNFNSELNLKTHLLKYKK